MADVGFVAASSDFVVVCQVEVEDQFFGHGPECSGFAEGFAITGIGSVNGADFKTGGVEAEDVFSEAVEFLVYLYSEERHHPQV